MAADWSCPRCQKENPGWREFCARCTAQKSSAPVGPGIGLPVAPNSRATGGTASRVGRLVVAMAGGLAVAVLAVIGLGSLLGGDEPLVAENETFDDSPSDRPLFSGGDLSEAERLERFLPHERDIGAGWSEVARGNSEQDLPAPDENSEIDTARAACGLIEEPGPEPGATEVDPSGIVVFEGENTDSQAILGVSLRPDVATAQAELDEIAGGPLLECLRSTIDAEIQRELTESGLRDVGLTFSVVSEVAAPPTDTEAGAHLRITATASFGIFSVPLYVDIYAMRQDRAFLYYQFFARGTPVPPHVVERLTQELVDNLTGILRETDAD